jgi:hypothetical protein
MLPSAGATALSPRAALESQEVEVTSISCPAPGGCTAVGLYVDASSTFHALLLDEADGLWQPAVEPTLPSGSPAGVHVSSVSCWSAGNCTAVGESGYGSQTGVAAGLLLSEIDGSWQRAAPAPLPAGADPTRAAGMSAVSCTGPGDCTATGSYEDAAGQLQAMLLTESGGRWISSVEAPVPSNGYATPQPQLSSISCVSPGTCSVAGTYADSSGIQQGLLLDEANGAWSATEAQLPPDASGGSDPEVELSSISCAAGGDCAAVGAYINSAGAFQGVLLTKAAGAWRPGVQAALPAGGGGLAPFGGIPLGVSAVSCPAAGSCVAVGYYTDTSGLGHGLLLTETGGAWQPGTVAPVPADAATSAGQVGQGQSGTGGTRLISVSCASVGNCSAVGVYSAAAGDFPGLMITESGGAWSSAVKPALPPDANALQDAALATVSCPTAASCGAGGSYADDLTQGARGFVIDRSGATWSAAVEPAAPGSVPTPVLDRGVAAAAKSGTVLVELPGSRRFVRLSSATLIPVGSVLDTRRGKVVLTSAIDTRGHTAVGTFYAGLFQIRQTKVKRTNFTVLTLTGPKPQGCKPAVRRALAPPAATHTPPGATHTPPGATHTPPAATHTPPAATHTPPAATLTRRRPTKRRLWGNARGNYRTIGQDASASERGTSWLTQDECDGTLIRVTHDSVLIDDFPHHRTFVLRAPRSFLVHPGKEARRPR